MFALARCGKALVACPASSMVATHVVRNVAFQPGSFADTRRDRLPHRPDRAPRPAWRWRWPVSPLAACIFAMPVKYARLPSVNCGGKGVGLDPLQGARESIDGVCLSRASELCPPELVTSRAGKFCEVFSPAWTFQGNAVPLGVELATRPLIDRKRRVDEVRAGFG